MQHFDSGPIIENAESENEERNKRPGSQRTKHSSGFMVAFKNAKTQQSKLHLVDMGKHDAYHKWFEISSAAGRAKSYKIDICQAIKCTCEYFSQKNTPCKHILYIYLFILNVAENSNLLQQIYLARTELNQLFTSNISEEQQSAKLTLKALLETTSTPKNNILVYPQKHVKLTSSLPQKPVLPEPQNHPYWLMKKLGYILKCRGCKEELGEIILGRLELDFFTKVGHVKETKHWVL